MDPLSITASILTLVGACSTILERYRRIREIWKVPDVLYSLNNEIADLKLVLLDIHEVREEFFRKDPTELDSRERKLLDLCHGLLERTWSKVREAEGLINSSIQTTGQRSISKLHTVFNPNASRRLARLQTSIRDANENIQNLWRQLDTRHSSQIPVQLSNVQETCTDVQSRSIENQSLLLDGNQRVERVEKKVDKLLDIQRTLSSPSPSLATDVSASVLSATPGTKRLDIALMRLPYMQVNFTSACHCRDTTRFSEYAHSFLGDLFLGQVLSPFSRCVERIG